MGLNADLGLSMDQLVRLVQTTHSVLAQQAAPSEKCQVCGGVKTVEQFTSAAAPTHRVKCFACGGTGKRRFNCFADKNPEAEWIAAEQRELAAPSEKPAQGELPPLPEPYTKAGREMAPTFQPLFSREQMHAYARAALASQPAASEQPAQGELPDPTPYLPSAPCGTSCDWDSEEREAILGGMRFYGEQCARAALASQPAARVALTDEQIAEMWSPPPGGDVRRPVLGLRKVLHFARAIERAHGITAPAAQEGNDAR